MRGSRGAALAARALDSGSCLPRLVRDELAKICADVVTRASRDAEMGGGEMTADELLAKAEKKMTTTLTRWKPDYESAMLYFDEAGA